MHKGARRKRVGARLVLGVGALSMAIAFAAGPASAIGAAPTWTDSDTGGPSGGGPKVLVNAVGQGVLVGTGSETIAMTCQAVAEGVVVATGVGCYLHGLTYNDSHFAPNLWLPGNVSETRAVFTGLRVQSYEICKAGGYLTKGGAFYQWATPITCSMSL